MSKLADRCAALVSPADARQWRLVATGVLWAIVEVLSAVVLLGATCRRWITGGDDLHHQADYFEVLVQALRLGLACFAVLTICTKNQKSGGSGRREAALSAGVVITYAYRWLHDRRRGVEQLRAGLEEDAGDGLGLGIPQNKNAVQAGDRMTPGGGGAGTDDEVVHAVFISAPLCFLMGNVIASALQGLRQSE